MTKQFKTIDQKWEELAPHKEQMELWAKEADRFESIDKMHPIMRNKLIKETLKPLGEDEQMLMYKVLKVAFEQFKKATEDELKIAE